MMVPWGRETGGQDQEGRKEGLNFFYNILFLKNKKYKTIM